MDWLDAAHATVPASKDCGLGTFMARVDVLLRGRHSFEPMPAFPKRR